MKEAPLLSVCLITYNHAKYIRQAIESVLMQQVNFTWELIIADDCSTDGTREIVLEYYNRYPDFIRLILQEKNVGPAKNWIDLITTPKSKYIAYLEGDDYWTDPLKLQKQVKFLEEKNKYAFCCHAYEVLNQRKKKIDISYLLRKNVTPPNATFDIAYYVTNKNVKSLSIVYRRSLVLNHEIELLFFKTPVPSSGDIPLILLLLTKGLGYFFSDKMGVYRLHDGGVTIKKKKNRIDPFIATLLKLYNYVDCQETRKFIQEKLIRSLKNNLRIGQFRLVFHLILSLTGFK